MNFAQTGQTDSQSTEQMPVNTHNSPSNKNTECDKFNTEKGSDKKKRKFMKSNVNYSETNL